MYKPRTTKKEIMAAENKLHCIQCKSDLSISSFYLNPFASTRFGERLPWCKNCLKEILKSFIRQNDGDNQYGFFEFCRMLDMPYIAKYAESLDISDNNAYADYVKKVRSRANRDKIINLCFDDGDFTSYIKLLKSKKEDKPAKDESTGDFEVTDEMRDYWNNPAYGSTEYKILWEHYNMLLRRFPNAEETQKLHFVALADFWCKRILASWDADGLKKEQAYEKMYIERFNTAGLSMKNTAKKDDTPLSLSEITTICEEDDFIEPWDCVVEYNHREDLISKLELDMINVARENSGKERLTRLPRWIKTEGTEYERFSEAEMLRAKMIDENANAETIITEAEEAEMEAEAEREKLEKFRRNKSANG